jgi:hypothetical protein
MARHTDITADLGIPIYFCARTHRGSAGPTNANGLLRQDFSKRTDLTVHSRTPTRRRERDQRTPPDRARRPDTGRPVRGIASLTGPATVATLTGTRHAARGSVFTCRRHAPSRQPRHVPSQNSHRDRHTSVPLGGAAITSRSSTNASPAARSTTRSTAAVSPRCGAARSRRPALTGSAGAGASARS